MSSPKDLFIDLQCHFLPVAYRKARALFLFFHENLGEAESSPCEYSRGDFLVLALKTLGVFQRPGIARSERFLNGFGTNSPLDLVFRLTAVLARATPVTLNWQADTPTRAAFKASLSEANLILTDGLLGAPIIEAMRTVRPGIKTYDTRKLPKEPFPVKLPEMAEQSQGLVVAPCVSRHFDFLEELYSRGELPIEKERLEKALSKVSFIMGSAPVGQTIVERVLRWSGHIPLVRFGPPRPASRCSGRRRNCRKTS